MEFSLGLLVGVILGAGIALAAIGLRSRLAAAQARRADQQMRETFSALAAEALDANARRLTDQAQTELEAKRKLIEQSIVSVREHLEQMRQMVQRVEAERKEDVGKLSSSVAALTTTAGKLHEMLSSSQRRGAWGERMAEDVLRLVGLAEGVNYTKQDAAGAEQGRPDFTFLLPHGLKANMDVKFPLDHYRAYVDARTDEARQGELNQLVQAVRGYVRDVAGRGYIDPRAPTVPYVIVFLPTEQLFSLVLGARPDVMDESLTRKVVLAGPMTLYAMLAVIRQAAENANVARTAGEVIELLGQFYKQWRRYNEELTKLGDRLESALKQYRAVVGTRTTALERPLERIEALRTAGALAEGADAAAENGEEPG